MNRLTSSLSSSVRRAVASSCRRSSSSESRSASKTSVSELTDSATASLRSTSSVGEEPPPHSGGSARRGCRRARRACLGSFRARCVGRLGVWGSPLRSGQAPHRRSEHPRDGPGWRANPRAHARPDTQLPATQAPLSRLPSPETSVSDIPRQHTDAPERIKHSFRVLALAKPRQDSRSYRTGRR